MDPASGLDAIRNVGIKGDRIAEISQGSLTGIKEIDATGMVVSPGFIDLHVHGMTNEAHRYQVRDGVTTALELESGRPFLREWLASKANQSIVNYGATISHGTLRGMSMSKYRNNFETGRKLAAENGMEDPALYKLMARLQPLNYQSLDASDIEFLKQTMRTELEAGALGIGVPVGYYPGATAGEVFEVYKSAAEFGVPVFSHTRGFGMPGIQEAIANATASGASLHIVHANSLSLGEIQVTIDMVAAAQKNGLDITTEVYPYTAASTSLESAIFDEGWQEKLGITFEDIQWEATGERLNAENFEAFRKQGGIVIIHMMKDEWIKKGIAAPGIMIGSDGMPYAPMAHPRTAGTFSRVLGKYVREDQVIDLMTALSKMTILPAKRLEGVAPMMLSKGRLQVGADADITIFNPAEIIDNADFKGLQYSEGVNFVIINGTLVVSDGTVLDGVYAGRPILGKYRN
jgi:dihydroorotase